MEHSKFLCLVCKRKGEEVFMIEQFDLLICPKCHTSFILEGKSPLGRYQNNWQKNAEEVFPLIRPPLYQKDLANPRLFYLYEDCYHTLLIGRYNASIILLGVLLEGILKERIELKLGIYFSRPYGDCLEKIEKEKLMDNKDIKFLRKFKDEVRNLYQHTDEEKIVGGLFVKVWPLNFEGGLSVGKMEKAIENIKSGKIRPILLPADIPAFRSIVKQEYDRRQSIYLFNQVYDFLLEAKIKYFKQKEYDEHHKKYGTRLEKIKHYKIQ